MGMTLFRYENADGSFDYEAYRRVQVEGNLKKLGNVWATREGVALAAGYLRANLAAPPRFGICHGTRRGLEQKWFAEELRCRVIGTEISPSAASFENTIEWDFHEVKPEWLGAADFIYSNSWDHSYDPRACFAGWMRCVRPGGFCVLEHTDFHRPAAVNRLDPFGIELDALVALLNGLGAGEYAVRDILEAGDERNTRFVCVGKGG